MTAQPVKRQKLTESVTEELLALIRRGGLEAGQRLAGERQLAEQMGVSRASVRDAIARLEVLGHLEVRHGDGLYVREPSAATLTQPFQGILTRLPQNTHDLLEFRRMLEPEVAALAAERATEEQLAQLRACIAQQMESVAQQRILLNEDLQFHALIAQMAGNQVVVLVLDTLQHLLRDLRQRDLLPHYPQRTVEHHIAIAQAIAARAPAQAHAAMTTHLNSVVENANEALARFEGGTKDA